VSPFTPVYRDGRSAASLIAELVSGKPYGYLLTFEEIAAQLEIDPSDLKRIHAAMQRTKPRLQSEHHRAIEAVTGEGYKILQPGDHARLATHHKKKSDRQIRRAIKVIKAADERDMTPAERERNRQLGMVLENHEQRIREVEARQSRLESLMLGGPKVIPGTAESVHLAIEAPGLLAQISEEAEPVSDSEVA